MKSIVTPDIVTERLLFKAHQLSDFEECAAMWGNTEVMRYLGGKPLTQEEVWARFLRYIGHWSVMGFGYWAVREKTSGRFVGDVGFAHYKREVTPSLGDAPEIGWVLSPWCYGQGFATEAARAVIQWGDKHLNGQRTVCFIEPENQSSLLVALKCGYKEYMRAMYHGELHIFFERVIDDGVPYD